MKRIFEYDTETLSKTEVDTVLSVNREEQEATESDITSIEDEDFTEEREKEENIEMSPIIPQDLIQKFMSRVEKSGLGKSGFNCPGLLIQCPPLWGPIIKSDPIS